MFAVTLCTLSNWVQFS